MQSRICGHFAVTLIEHSDGTAIGAVRYFLRIESAPIC
jgi:hypothetical protein